jgi:predicted DNA-binding protein
MTRKKIRTETLRVRLSVHEDQKLRAFAEHHDHPVSRVIREYIRRLPNYQSGKTDLSLADEAEQ